MWTLFQIWTLNKAHPKRKALSKLFGLAGGRTSTLTNWGTGFGDLLSRSFTGIRTGWMMPFLNEKHPHRSQPPFERRRSVNRTYEWGKCSQHHFFQASLGASRSGSAAPGLPEPAEVTTTSDEARLMQLANLFTDIRIAVSRIMGLWSSEIGVLLPEPDEGESLKGQSPNQPVLINLNTQLADVLQTTLSQLSSLEPYISNQIVLTLTRRCCEPVAQVKQVTGQIRAMTRRSHTASSPSPFVSEILKPLRDFFGMGGVVSRNSLNKGAIGRALREEFGGVWATEILREVAIRWELILRVLR